MARIVSPKCHRQQSNGENIQRAKQRRFRTIFAKKSRQRDRRQPYECKQKHQDVEIWFDHEAGYATRKKFQHAQVAAPCQQQKESAGYWYSEHSNQPHSFAEKKEIGA